MQFTEVSSELAALLKTKIADADAVLIGAGAGLSTAAGFDYSGERFSKVFSDFNLTSASPSSTRCPT